MSIDKFLTAQSEFVEILSLNLVDLHRSHFFGIFLGVFFANLIG